MKFIGLSESSERRRRAKLLCSMCLALGSVLWSCDDSVETRAPDSETAQSGEGGRTGSTYLRVDAGAASNRDAGTSTTAAPAAGAPAPAGSVAPSPMDSGVPSSLDAGTPMKVDSGAATGVDAGPSPAGMAAPPPADAGQPDACVPGALQEAANKVPVDIVWAIDSTSSVRQERAAIQRGLNDFVTALASAGIDAHVVVICDEDDFEVPAPLGTDRVRFLFVDRKVGSDDGLSVFADRFNEYEGFLRPEAALELIAVTDDESDISAIEFLSDMRARTAKPFRLHAVASERVDGDACKGARSPGDEYFAAAALTSGVTFSICAAQDPALFTTLVDGLRTQLPAQCPPGRPEPG